jgi:hypothetical protein
MGYVSLIDGLTLCFVFLILLIKVGIQNASKKGLIYHGL